VEALLTTRSQAIHRPVSLLYEKLFTAKAESVEPQARCLALFAAVQPDTLVRFSHECVAALEGTDQVKAILMLTALKGEPYVGVLDVVPVKVYSPYCLVLVVPLLKRFSSSLGFSVRELFGEILRVVALSSSAAAIDPSLEPQRNESLKFLGYLSGKFTLPEYSLSVEVGVELRHYQREGVRWLQFLRQFNLNGMLCDDMGLGKTLQALCVIAESHRETACQHSLVVCPASLVNHWVAEVHRYFHPSDLTAEVCRKLPFSAKLVVTSYDNLKRNVDQFNQTFCYVVLDEGHIIKSSKTKAFRAIKALKSEHSLVLSGTPVQNQILEVWSYFDFLMPGFLGAEDQFSKLYRKDLAPKAGTTSFKDEVVAMTKLDSLHKQILPFILRRKKTEVLTELPSKIIQDYLVEFDEAQTALLHSFKQQGKVETFTELAFLRKLCNHPRLVSPKAFALMDSPKLRALKDLVKVCEVTEESGANHKALVFSQMKAMLDLVAEMLLTEFPRTRLIRLDGSVPSLQRQDVVDEFNRDDNIRVMLLTTDIGGLGFSLTAADVVIFIDHDWNPIKDLQAMDRAHRLGQKRVVNVYRLITQDSLEERILGLQAFKTKIAETLVTADNSSLSSLDTAELLEHLSKGS
jgi:TATA-binding protein-associated factor